MNFMMALLTFMPSDEVKKQSPKQQGKRNKHQKKKKKKPIRRNNPSSWEQIKSILTCKQIQDSTLHQPSSGSGYSKLLGSACGSICTLRGVVHGTTRVVHRADDTISSDGTTTVLVLNNNNNNNNNNNTCMVSSRGRPHLSKLSGCYECRMIVDPARYPISPTCACPDCGELFPKLESLELHQAVRHAVSELGPEDSGRNIVEIIFKSSWLKKDTSVCKIERILKVRNTPRTVRRFEECRDAVKARAITTTKKNPRCAADGNELLRFHCAALTCALGAHGSSRLCSASSAPIGGGACAACAIIRHGFQGKRVRTTASSGKAHDCLGLGQAHGGCRAMLVCRVIAGRMRRVTDDAPLVEEEGAVGGGRGLYDSVAGCSGGASSNNIEDLVVYNPTAILPCFVVIYKALQF